MYLDNEHFYWFPLLLSPFSTPPTGVPLGHLPNKLPELKKKKERKERKKGRKTEKTENEGKEKVNNLSFQTETFTK